MYHKRNVSSVITILNAKKMLHFLHADVSLDVETITCPTHLVAVHKNKNVRDQNVKIETTWYNRIFWQHKLTQQKWKHFIFMLIIEKISIHIFLIHVPILISAYLRTLIFPSEVKIVHSEERWRTEIVR